VPVADELDFIDDGAVRRIPYEVDEISGAGSGVIIAAGRTKVDIHGEDY
jgi:hypothetical protein